MSSGEPSPRQTRLAQDVVVHPVSPVAEALKREGGDALDACRAVRLHVAADHRVQRQGHLTEEHQIVVVFHHLRLIGKQADLRLQPSQVTPIGLALVDSVPVTALPRRVEEPHIVVGLDLLRRRDCRMVREMGQRGLAEGQALGHGVEDRERLIRVGEAGALWATAPSAAHEIVRPHVQHFEPGQRL